MSETPIPENMITTSKAAEMFGKDASHVRRVCKENKLGQLKYGRLRLLRQSDIDWLKRYFEEFGRNRQKSDSPT